MSLVSEIKTQMFAAMKAGRTVEKEVLRVVLGELTMAEARAGQELSADDGIAILKKLVKSNEETLNLVSDAAKRGDLEQELAILRAYLPKTLGPDEIVAALAPVLDGIRGAKSDGQATGIAMKHMKSLGAEVEGKDVGAAVSRIRKG